MDKYARDMKLQNTCGQDLARGNALAQEALEGFRNYRLYREVGCQRDNTTQASYCFADASANAEPDALYFYYLVSFVALPSRAPHALFVTLRQIGSSFVVVL